MQCGHIRSCLPSVNLLPFIHHIRQVQASSSRIISHECALDVPRNHVSGALGLLPRGINHYTTSHTNKSPDLSDTRKNLKTRARPTPEAAPSALAGACTYDDSYMLRPYERKYPGSLCLRYKGSRAVSEDWVHAAPFLSFWLIARIWAA